MGGVVNCAAYADGRWVADVEVTDISKVLKQHDWFVWIGLHEPSAALRQQVQREFGLHDLAIEDAHSAHQRPKLERYGEALFIVLRTAQMQQGHIQFGETHIFVGPRYIVSVRHGSSLAYTAVRARCEVTPHLPSQGPGFVLYALMDFIVDQYFPIVDALKDELEALEEDVFGEAVCTLMLCLSCDRLWVTHWRWPGGSWPVAAFMGASNVRGGSERGGAQQDGVVTLYLIEAAIARPYSVMRRTFWVKAHGLACPYPLSVRGSAHPVAHKQGGAIMYNTILLAVALQS